MAARATRSKKQNLWNFKHSGLLLHRGFGDYDSRMDFSFRNFSRSLSREYGNCYTFNSRTLKTKAFRSIKSGQNLGKFLLSSTFCESIRGKLAAIQIICSEIRCGDLVEKMAWLLCFEFWVFKSASSFLQACSSSCTLRTSSIWKASQLQREWNLPFMNLEQCPIWTLASPWHLDSKVSSQWIWYDASIFLGNLRRVFLPEKKHFSCVPVSALSPARMEAQLPIQKLGWWHFRANENSVVKSSRWK